MTIRRTLPTDLVCAEDQYGDHTVRHKETGDLIGWIEKGRAMTDLNSNWTEWQFTPADRVTEKSPVRMAFSAAREDARVYAEMVAGELTVDQKLSS